MGKTGESESHLKTVKSPAQPGNVNPEFTRGAIRRKRREYTVDEYVEGITGGDRTVLGRAITLVESNLPRHHDTSQEIVDRCLAACNESLRIGITGVPGAGKSTFIESFGLHLTDCGHKVAVLAIDPSSTLSKGSILGDKTRMERLSCNPDAFIRPSPSAGSLGGVARKTRETIILCEAAGFDTIIVETVGVGQSETVVRSMVDLFLLLMISGAGDELQGIKRGIMEMADIIAINKADGSNRMAAESARVMYSNVISLFPGNTSGWKPEVLTCSAREVTGIRELYDKMIDYVNLTRDNGFFQKQRREQAVDRMHDYIAAYLERSFYGNRRVKHILPEIERLLREEKITSYKAAARLIDKYNENEDD